MSGMSPAGARAATAVAVGVAIAATAAGVALSLMVASRDAGDLGATVLSTLAASAFTVVGAIVAAARPRNRVGWLMLAAGVGWAVGAAAVDVGQQALAAPGSGRSALVAVCLVTGSALRGVAWWLAAVGLPMWFPDGQLAGPRWRGLPRALVAVLIVSALGVVTASDANLSGLTGWQNPVALPAASQWLSGLLSLGSTLAGVVCAGWAVSGLWHRWRRGGLLERQQLVLLAAATCLPVLAAPVVLATGDGWWFSVAAVPLPIAVGFAVLARGLYDLRTAVSRTLVWVTLSGLVAGLYALVLVGVGGRFDATDERWLPWLAAAVVAVTFAPLRDLLQRTVNRVVFGRWDEPYDVLASLGQRLEATADVDRLLADVVSELEGLGLSDVLVTDAEHRVVAGRTAADESAASRQRLPLSAYGSVSGELSFQAPPAGLRPRDLQLLENLAGHLGGVLHARELTADLRDALERAVMAREEERRRLRRDLHDGLGPSLAGHRLRLDLIAATMGRDCPAAKDVDQLRIELAATVLEVRQVVEGLRPPALDELGLAGALTQMTSRLAAGSSVVVDVAVDDVERLPAAVEVAAFRIVSEAVTNTVRHSDADVCRVRVEVAGDQLLIRVRDNGSGIAKRQVGGTTPEGGAADTRSTADGNGLATMDERAHELGGKLTVLTGEGTTVVAELPLGPGRVRHPVGMSAGRPG